MKQIVALLIVLFLLPLTASAQDFCEGNFDFDDDNEWNSFTDRGWKILKSIFGENAY